MIYSHDYYESYQNMVKHVYKNKLSKDQIAKLLRDSIEMYKLCHHDMNDHVKGEIDALIDFLTEKEVQWGMKY